MLSALVNSTKALVKLVENYSDNNKKITEYQRDLTLDNQCIIMDNNNELSTENMQGSIFDCIRTIRDPEKPATLEDLEVVYEDGVKVSVSDDCRAYIVDIEFNPTVPHCSLATLIGLCMRVKVERCHLEKIKLDIRIKKGAHDSEEDINKQINDKERVAAAMENPNLKEMVEKCIKEED